MSHQSRQPMPPTAARLAVLEAENEALRRRIGELEADLDAERDGPFGKPPIFKSRRQK